MSMHGQKVKELWTDNLSKGVGLEYSWQKVTMVNAYFSLKYEMKGFNCLRLCFGTGFFARNSSYWAPTAVLSYNVGTPVWWYGDNQIMINLAVAAWGFQTEGKYDYRISPEIGLANSGMLSISYGYNMPMGPVESGFIARNRITVRFTIDQ